LVYDSLSKSVTYHGMSFRCLHIWFHVHTCFWRMILGMGWAVVKAAFWDGWQRWSQRLQQTLRQWCWCWNRHKQTAEGLNCRLGVSSASSC
jgi:hypothetical protein